FCESVPLQGTTGNHIVFARRSVMRFLRSGCTSALLLWCLVAAAHAATPVTVSNIEAMTNWHDCTTCANGAGTAVYSMTQHQASPSLNGNSTKFSLAGTVGLSYAVWYRRSVEKSTGVNFAYQLYSYYTHPAAPSGM